MIKSIHFALLVCQIITFAHLRPIEADESKPLSQTTRAVIKSFSDQEADKPVQISAFVSPKAPRGYVDTIRNIRNVLKQVEEIGGDQFQIHVINTEPYSEVAKRAYFEFNIRPLAATQALHGVLPNHFVFCHVVVKQGDRTILLPPLGRAAPVEYELLLALQE